MTGAFPVKGTGRRAGTTPEVWPRARTPDRLARELAGDLDNILLMALRREPERRYASVEQLAGDIERYLAGLPLRGWGPAPVRVFQVIEDLLITYGMPPALTAELYRALGNIPGVTVDRHATDIAGRHGIGFKIAIPSEQGGGFDELILDPKTFRLMGQQLTLGQAAGAKAGQIVGGVAILKTALVSGPDLLQSFAPGLKPRVRLGRSIGVEVMEAAIRQSGGVDRLRPTALRRKFQ